MKRDAKHEPQKRRLFSSTRQLPVRSALKDDDPTPVFLLFKPFPKKHGNNKHILLYMKQLKLSRLQKHNYFKTKINFIVDFVSCAEMQGNFKNNF